jgi:hypothetical protein
MAELGIVAAKGESGLAALAARVGMVPQAARLPLLTERAFARQAAEQGVERRGRRSHNFRSRLTMNAMRDARHGYSTSTTSGP